MIEICAAMGLTNLDSHDKVVAINKRNHAAYTAALGNIPGISVLPYGSTEDNSHHYVILEVQKDFAATRDQLVAALQAENVMARKYFWPGAHKMTEAIAEKLIVLPTGTAISEESIRLITSVISIVANS